MHKLSPPATFFIGSLLLCLLISLNQANAAPPEQGDGLIRMADNFFIIYDPSSSMDSPYRDTGLTRLEAEKKIIRESNAALPELGWQAGLYPHWKGGLWLHGSPMAFKPFYPLSRYQKASFSAAIEQLPIIPVGPPMLQRGLMKLEHLLGLPGRTEIFIFSDGKDSTVEKMEPQPLEQAQKLAKQFNVCFTIVSSAGTPEDQKRLQDIASVNACSQVMSFDTVYNNPEHLFGKLYMNGQDSGFGDVLFDFDKYGIKPHYAATLDQLGHFLSTHPESSVVLSGFTDSVGSEAYNITLSQQRAETVQHYLNTNFRIKRDRMLLYWYGVADPVAGNASEKGRQLNRRVTIVIRDHR